MVTDDTDLLAKVERHEPQHIALAGLIHNHRVELRA
jgi:hypothetical protein